MITPTVYQSEGEVESQTLVIMKILTVYQSEEEVEEGEVKILKAMTIPTVYLSITEGGDMPEEVGYLAWSTLKIILVSEVSVMIGTTCLIQTIWAMAVILIWRCSIQALEVTLICQCQCKSHSFKILTVTPVCSDQFPPEDLIAIGAHEVGVEVEGEEDLKTSL